MAYSWDTELAGDVSQRQKATAFHETDFLKSYVRTQASHTYLPAPETPDYLSKRLRGELEGLTENLYRLNNFEPANTSHSRTGTYDIATKLGLYNPANSINVNYSPKRKIDSYQREEDSTNY